MKTISTQFQKFGDTFAQIKRVGDVAQYERSYEGKTQGYEVVKVQKFKADRFINGVQVNFEGDEFYPSSEQFGAKAFNCKTLERADMVFDEMVG